MGDHELEIKYDDEAKKSPFGQVFLKLYSPNSEAVIHCAMVVRDPIDVESLKNTISNSMMMKHPRFCSLWVRKDNQWKRTHVNIDDHIIVHDTIEDDDNDDEEAAINSFLAEISVCTPLSESKPLWEVHVLTGLKCVVLRVHHSVGDGVSLMSMLSACFGKTTPVSETGNGVDDASHGKKDGEKHGVWGLVKRKWFTFLLLLFRVLGRVLWLIKDKVSVLSGGHGVEILPRKLVTAKFLMEDFKSIKQAIPKATINDVLLGIISSGFSKYLSIKSSNAVQQAFQLTAIIAVNLRKDFIIQDISDLMITGSRSRSELSGWGNKTMVVFLPINCCNGLHPLEHVRAMKAAMDKKKQSFEAHLMYRISNFVVSCFGPKVGSWCCRRLEGSTTLVISNIRGPSEEIVIGDNPVTNIKVNVSSTSQAIMMHMVSYAGQVNLQVIVAKDIIPDPELLVKCFQDSFLEMKSFIDISQV
ncbi:hypothetical protein SOVF_103630 [Spinacia oleracea]|uniref:Wax ester synthase/diacylglycerol acyltransferase 10 n=1 Tax=Spinacia oleracea TaxID=3562 RepID=A0A9R0JFB9_SPIOL|nr:wax ester synthase/diacylglycerol acyltransferase 10-like [Spinacia oleracea]KNA14851.1 hypothetical protein SOVF_103630 [Spinacia oleracea]